MLWARYYDRQDVIQSDGISVVADSPRLLVHLLSFNDLPRRIGVLFLLLTRTQSLHMEATHGSDPGLRGVSRPEPVTDHNPTSWRKDIYKTRTTNPLSYN